MVFFRNDRNCIIFFNSCLAKVIKFNYMARGVSFKMRIRLKKDLNGETNSDHILWYRWIKRAIDFSGDAGNCFK